MSKKLTLNIDDDLIQFAHLYSEETGISISTIFEQYLQKLRDNKSNEKLNPQIEGLYGAFEGKPIPNKKQLMKIFYEKSLD